MQEEPTMVVFTTGQVPGAIPNGTRVVKVEGDPRDANPIGAFATVIGSVGPMTPPDYPDDGPEYGYFVFWDAYPGVPVFVRGRKLAKSEA